jgi:hypothetical protein
LDEQYGEQLLRFAFVAALYFLLYALGQSFNIFTALTHALGRDARADRPAR